jgi:hypothetical protein
MMVVEGENGDVGKLIIWNLYSRECEGDMWKGSQY